MIRAAISTPWERPITALLTGKSPFADSESVPQLMYAHCHGAIPDPRSINPTIPAACSRIIARAMAKAPADRYQTTAEMQSDLQAVLAALSGQNRIDLPSDSATVAARTVTHTAAPTSSQHAYEPWRRLVVPAAAIIIMGGAVASWLAWGGKPSSGDGAAGTSQPAAPTGAHALTATAPGVTATEITLGMSAPFSGPAKELGRGMQIGIETYLKYQNGNAGGIHGRKLSYWLWTTVTNPRAAWPR